MHTVEYKLTILLGMTTNVPYVESRIAATKEFSIENDKCRILLQWKERMLINGVITSPGSEISCMNDVATYAINVCS